MDGRAAPYGISTRVGRCAAGVDGMRGRPFRNDYRHIRTASVNDAFVSPVFADQSQNVKFGSAYHNRRFGRLAGDAKFRPEFDVC